MGPGIIRPSRLGRRTRRTLALTAAAAATCVPIHATAQDIATARSTALIEQPITVINTDDMDFGKIAYTATAGTVAMTPAGSATCTATGGLIRTGTCRAARFEGDVRFLFLLQVQQPVGDSILLTGPGGATMRLDTFTYGAGPGLLDFGQSGVNHRFWVLNFDGSYSFYMGGTLHVGANQLPGVYSGTFQIQLNYN